MPRWLWLTLLSTLACAPTAVPPAAAPARAAAVSSSAPKREEAPTETDEYTRYELLDPASASFHILYEVTAISTGAPAFFNPIRKGSVASGERVFDRASGQELHFEVVSGEEAAKSGLADADRGTDYIRIHLAHPIPPDGGQARLLIEKTYKDPKSYFEDTGTIVFSRSLGIRRNSVLLPVGYELVSCNVPSQVLSESSGRILVSFMNPGPDAAPLLIRARKLPS